MGDRLEAGCLNKKKTPGYDSVNNESTTANKILVKFKQMCPSWKPVIDIFSVGDRLEAGYLNKKTTPGYDRINNESISTTKMLVKFKQTFPSW